MTKLLKSAPGTIVKSKSSGDLYEIQYVVHPQPNFTTDEVYACYRLSGYDGMPIGGRVWIAAGEFEDAKS